MSYPMIKMTGDNSIAVVFGNEISEEIYEKVSGFDKVLHEADIDGIFETVPSYTAVTIHYSPLKLRYAELCEKIRPLMDQSVDVSVKKITVMEFPVCYGGEYGPDLEHVAEVHGMTPQEVIDIHAGTEYLIYMLGFLPGFSYMGGMDERIATPRLETPRILIPAGSVGIAGAQTGIYPSDSPGGWQLIGRTPVVLYDPHRETPILPYAGLYVKFVPIPHDKFDEIYQACVDGTYVPVTYEKEVE